MNSKARTTSLVVALRRRSAEDVNVERRFCRTLSERGLTVEYESNRLERSGG